MPSLNLRLSREQHEALVVAARDSARSLQREIVWRLFRGRDDLVVVEGRGVSGPTQISAAEGLGVDVPSAAPRSRQPDAGPSVVSAASVARRISRSEGKCGADVARSTRCKLCGEVHK